MAEAIGIIATLFVILYFSRKQTQSLSVDIETKILNDLDYKLHGILQMGVERPRANQGSKQYSIKLVTRCGICLSYPIRLCTCLSYASKKSIKRQRMDWMVEMDGHVLLNRAL